MEFFLLVLIAGCFIAIQLTRNLRMNVEIPASSAGTEGFRFFLAWLAVGGPVACMTWLAFVFAGIGGFSEPPDIWVFCYLLGRTALPFLLTLGGVPAAIQIAHGHAWRKPAWIGFAVCATSWLVLVGVVFLGPSVFGWSW